MKRSENEKIVRPELSGFFTVKLLLKKKINQNKKTSVAFTPTNKIGFEKKK